MKHVFLGIMSLLLLCVILASPGGRLHAYSDYNTTQNCVRYFSYYEKKYAMPDDMLHAIGVTESGKWNKVTETSAPWPWTVNVNGKGYFFSSKKEAVNAVLNFQREGAESIDVGCMQVNLRHHPDAFKNLQQALEPKYNIGYAAKFLNDHYQQTHNWKKTIARYHSMDRTRGGKYLARVMDKWDELSKAYKLALASNT